MQGERIDRAGSITLNVVFLSAIPYLPVAKREV
jgi:hypothetical protein